MRTISAGQQALKAISTFKDEYLLDYINVEELDVRDSQDVDEKVVENAIIHNVKNFILTFGKDFAFVRNQYHLDAFGENQYIDLDLKTEAEVLRQEIETQEHQNQNLEQFIQKVRKYAELTELTPYVAHEVIKAIYVGAPDKSSGKRRQSIHICYDLIGFIPLSELMTQEMA